jgi:peptidyl-prolyl cis-trans isomerase C
LALAACSGDGDSNGKGAKASFPDSVVDEELILTVNSHPIRGRDIRVFTLLYGSGTEDSLRNRAFNERLVDGMIDRTLLWLEADAMGITIDDSTQQWFVREFTRAVGGEAVIDEMLLKRGFTRFDLESLIRQDLKIRAFLENNVARPVDVPDSVAIAYYEANPGSFWTPDSVRARHIIIRKSQDDTDLNIEAKKQTLRGLRERVLAGEDFAELAKTFSEGPSAPDGGDLGYFTQRDMVASFSNAAFALKPGEVSDVVETPFGYHLIQVIDKKPSRKLSYDEVAEGLKQQIAQFYVDQNFQNHLQQSRAVAIIERNY